jgi:hypothetical protein
MVPWSIQMNQKTIIVCAILLLLALLPLVFVKQDITGFFTVIDVAPRGFIPTVEDASREDAGIALQNIESDINAMKNNDLNTKLSEDALTEAQESFKKEQYVRVLELSQLVSFIKRETMNFPDMFALANQRKDELEKRGVDVFNSDDLLQRSMLAFTQEQFDDARDLLSQATDTLEKSRMEHERRENIAFLSKNVFLRYWWQILLTITVLAVLARPVFKKVRKQQLKSKLEHLHTEMNEIKALMKKLQHDCFIAKKMTTTTFKRKVARYEERLAEIKHTIPVVQAQLTRKHVIRKRRKGVIEVR